MRGLASICCAKCFPPRSAIRDCHRTSGGGQPGKLESKNLSLEIQRGPQAISPSCWIWQELTRQKPLNVPQLSQATARHRASCASSLWCLLVHLFPTESQGLLNKSLKYFPLIRFPLKRLKRDCSLSLKKNLGPDFFLLVLSLGFWTAACSLSCNCMNYPKHHLDMGMPLQDHRENTSCPPLKGSAMACQFSLLPGRQEAIANACFAWKDLQSYSVSNPYAFSSQQSSTWGNCARCSIRFRD